MNQTPVLIGILLSVAILAGWLVAPALRSSERKAADTALEQAELAQRKFFRYSPWWGHLNQLAEPGEVLGADLSGFAERATDTIQALNARLGPDLQAINRQAAAAGLPELRVVQPMATDSALRQAVQAFSAAQAGNAQLLATALEDAQAAAAASSQTVGVQQVLGQIQMASAEQLLAEAEGQRNQLAEQLARLMASAALWKEAQGQADYFAGLEVTEVIAGLQRDLVELEALTVEGAARLAELTTLVEERAAAVARVEAGLGEARAALLALEARGFTAGNDASFTAYRDQYLRLSDQLRILEEQEQELRFGVRRGASLEGDDLSAAEIVGGQPVEGLDKLQTRQAIAAERARRLQSAQEALGATIATWSDATDTARTESRRIRAQMERLAEEQKTLIEAITRLAAEAFEREKSAASAAQSAVRAFQSSQSALDSWIGAAQEAQQQDASGKNERLRLITSDPYTRWPGASAEGAARLLEARCHAQIIEGNQSILDDMRLYASLNPAFSFDDTPFQAAITTARDAALDTLEQARGIFAEKLSRGPEASRWVPQAALAAVYQLRGRIDPSRAEEYIQRALETLGQALARREQSPYLREHARFRDFLSGGRAPAPDLAPDLAPAPDPATPPSGEDENP